MEALSHLIWLLTAVAAFIGGLFLGEHLAQQDHLDSLHRIRDALDGREGAGLTD